MDSGFGDFPEIFMVNPQESQVFEQARYEASMSIPAGTQLVHNYGSEWWKDRPELKRSNVGTDSWPRAVPVIIHF